MKEDVQMIPIERIRILNPRLRDKKKFELIVQSIKNLGLKKPIQVSKRATDEAESAAEEMRQPNYGLLRYFGRTKSLAGVEIRSLSASRILCFD